MPTLFETKTTDAGVKPANPSANPLISPETKGKIVDSGKKVIEKGKDGLDVFLDETLDPSFDVASAADAGLAFAYALADGWSFGLLDTVLDQIPGMEDATAALAKRNPTATTIGDIGSFISPAIAAKLWIGAGKILYKTSSKVLTEYAGKTSKEHGKKTVAEFKSHIAELKKKDGLTNKVSLGVAQKEDLARIMGVKFGEVDKVLKKFGFEWVAQLSKYVRGHKGQGAFKESIRKLSAGNTTRSTFTLKIAAAIGRAARADAGTAKLLATLDKYNLTPEDFIQVFLARSAAYKIEIARGKSEEEAFANSWITAGALVVGKGISAATFRRVKSLMEGGFMTSVVGRTFYEYIVGFSAINASDLNAMYQQAGDAVSDVLDKGIDYIGNRGKSGNPVIDSQSNEGTQAGNPLLQP